MDLYSVRKKSDEIVIPEKGGGDDIRIRKVRENRTALPVSKKKKRRNYL